MKVHNEGNEFPVYHHQIVEGDIRDVEEAMQRTAIVRAGFTVVLESLDDLDVIEAVVMEFIHVGEGAYDTLLPVLREIDANAESWRHPRDQLRQISNSLLNEVPDDPEKASSIQTLYVAVRAIRELWEASLDESNVNVALSMHPNPTRQADCTRELDEFYLDDVLLTLGHSSEPYGDFMEDTPALILKPGSLSAGLALSVIRGTKWVLTAYGAVRAFFNTSKDASDFFVKKMREKALQTSRPLPCLSTMSSTDKQDLRAAKHVVVLLHGLFSTDAGTFDGLRDCWDDHVAKNAGGNDPAVHWVGWPHDTLATITENARDLYSLFATNLKDMDSDILFVCHSRGGLLARAACQELFGRGDWDDRLKGCVTFGSPHEGANLARNPLKTAGGYALVYGATGAVKAFDSLLIYMHHRKRIDGIDDLAPKANPVSRFLEQLEISELNATRRLDLVAIGGDVTNAPASGNQLKQKLTSLMRWGNQALVGGSKHDLVVTTASSIPNWITDRHTVPVDHFTYFDKLDTGARLGIDIGIDRIKRAFGFSF